MQTYNQQKLKDKYTSYRMKIKKLKNGSLEKRELNKEMSGFLKSVAQVFGQDAANELTKKL